MSEKSQKKENKSHPCGILARNWVTFFVAQMGFSNYVGLKKTIEKAAMSGNEVASKCYKTLCELEKLEEVSDLDVLGLAFYLIQLQVQLEKKMEEIKKDILKA